MTTPQPMIFPVASLPISHYDQGDLIKLRERITELLPSTSDLDLQQEIVLQFISAKKLFSDAQDDSDIALNQKAQILNSTAALLKQLKDSQVELYSAERNRLQERALITALQAFPELHTEFLKDYTTRLEAIE